MSSNWPPALKTYVNETFAKCTDANRAAVETELKGLIFKAYEQKQLWTIDWANVKLTSLEAPKKRKAFAPSIPHSFGISSPSVVGSEDDRREKRARRFEAERQAAARASAGGSGSGGGGGGFQGRIAQGGSNPYWNNGGVATPEPENTYDPNVIDWDKETIVGTSTKLEKPFLRLTSIPDPATIRPLPVLKKTLELLKTKWREENNYGYICDQFKSMRQDLTVQRIKNDFTCVVYEIHGRIALEKGDLGEFNQCQGQLRDLYKHGLPGHVMEFLGYRILYLLFSKNRAELNSTLASLTDAETQDPSVSHALAVRLAVTQGNYTKLFRLFMAAPKMGAYIMDHFVERERIAALVTMTKAYQLLPLKLIRSQLQFDSFSDTDKFLQQFHANIYKPTTSSVPGSSTSTPLNGTPAPTPTPAAAIDDEQKMVDCKAVHPRFVEAMAKFNKVDLKGQI